MKRFLFASLSILLAASACGPAVSRDKSGSSSAEVTTMVDGLYKEVIARHPLGTPDRKVFKTYLSQGLLHSFDVNDACLARWRQANPDPDTKPNVGLIEFGVFSGGVDFTEPQAFVIEKVDPEKDGSFRAHVKLTHSEQAVELTWYVVPVVIVENDRPVVDDIIYLKQGDRDEARLSDLLKQDCKG